MKNGLLETIRELFSTWWNQDRIRVSTRSLLLGSLRPGDHLIFRDHLYVLIQVEELRNEEIRNVRVLHLSGDEGHHARPLFIILVASLDGEPSFRQYWTRQRPNDHDTLLLPSEQLRSKLQTRPVGLEWECLLDEDWMIPFQNLSP